MSYAWMDEVQQTPFHPCFSMLKSISFIKFEYRQEFTLSFHYERQTPLNGSFIVKKPKRTRLDIYIP